MSATVTVTIKVTNDPEEPVISIGGLAVSGPGRVDYAEDRTDAVATYMASGPDAASARWSLSGDDAGDFRISSAGVLTFDSSPDFDTPRDADGDNEYTVTVMANDGTYEATRSVTITVTAEDEVVVEPGETLLDRSDTDGDGEISKAEVIVAFREYVASDGQIDKAEIIAVFRKYIQD